MRLSLRTQAILIVIGCIIVLELLIALGKSVKTPEIRGVVVDAETMEPLSGAAVHAGWATVHGGPGGQSHGFDLKDITLRTGNDGSFVIPPYRVINFLPWPFGQGWNFGFGVYAHGYKNRSFGFSSQWEIENPRHDELKEGYRI
jgi:hypothetical protein